MTILKSKDPKKPSHLNVVYRAWDDSEPNENPGCLGQGVKVGLATVAFFAAFCMKGDSPSLVPDKQNDTQKEWKHNASAVTQEQEYVHPTFLPATATYRP